MGTKARPVDRHRHEIGPLGWFTVVGFLSMGALYIADIMAASSVVSPVVSLSIGVVAGIGVLLFWYGRDPTAGYTVR